MIDKVQRNVPANYTKDVTPVARKSDSSLNKGGEIDTTSAEVTLSENALALQRIVQAVKDAPDIRSDLVQSIQEQLAAGKYQVNLEALAERLLSLMK